MPKPHHHEWKENEEKIMPIDQIAKRLILIGEKLKTGSVTLNDTKIEPKTPVEMITRYEIHQSGTHVLKLEMKWKDETKEDNHKNTDITIK